MKPRRCLLIALLPLLLAAIAPAADAWFEVRSPHFTVISDAGEKRGRDVAMRLEQMRSAFGVVVNRDHVNIPVPVVVVAFKSGKELRRYAPLFNGKPIELAGIYQQGQDRNYIALDLSANNALEAIFHEYGHMLLNGNYPTMPLWFDEGFAQYYETLTVDHTRVQVGKPPESAPYVFQQFRLMPVEQLLAVQHGSREYNESGDHRTIFYLQSWLLVHYLFDRKKLKEMSEYAYLVESQHVLPVDALQRAFGLTPAQLQKELESYMRGITVTTYTLSREIQPTEFTSRPLDPVDAAAALADLHLHEMDYQAQAISELEAILQTSPANLSAHAGLGYAYLRRGDLEKAGPHFREAAKDTKDARVLYYSAMLAHMRGASSAEDYADMKQKAAKAVALDPDFADAYSMLAYGEAGLGEYEDATRAIQKAFELSPRNESYAMYLGEMYMAQKKWEEAAAIFTVLKQSPNGPMVAQAQSALELIERAKSSKAVRVSMSGDRIEMSGESAAPALVRRSGRAALPPEGPTPAPVIDKRPMQFLKGTLVAVDCTTETTATMTVSAAGKKWTFQTLDRQHIVLMGADRFSCDWKNVKVAINYRLTAPNAGELFSIEVQ
jgi:Flp pilus assembly protein TadD